MRRDAEMPLCRKTGKPFALLRCASLAPLILLGLTLADAVAQTHDVEVRNIQVPIGTIGYGPVRPQCRVRNRGTQPESFWTYFRIRNNIGGLVYFDSTYVLNLEPDVNFNVTFNIWAAIPGNYSDTAFTILPGDIDPSNDTATATVLVDTFNAYGWRELTSIPAGTALRGVKDGGALRNAQPGIFCMKGNKTNEFYLYDIGTNTWVAKASVADNPMEPRPVKAGGALAYFRQASKLYALKGNRTLDFLSYDTNTDSWKLLTPVPAGLRDVKKGSALAVQRQGGTDEAWVYCLKGSKTDEFYAYSVLGDSWITTLARPPLGVTLKPYDQGNALHMSDYLYLLKGKSNELFAYDTDLDTWTTRRPMPFVGMTGKKKKVKDGASLCEADDIIYAFKGGNTQELWAYLPLADSWYERDTIPCFGSTGKKKRVNKGGSLVSSGGRLYAVKGNNTVEFWTYADPPVFGTQPTLPSQGASGFAGPGAQPRLSVSPTIGTGPFTIRISLPGPGPAALSLHDAAGRLIRGIPHPRSGLVVNKADLAPGLYFLRLEHGRHRACAKVIRI